MITEIIIKDYRNKVCNTFYIDINSQEFIDTVKSHLKLNMFKVIITPFADYCTKPKTEKG